MLEHLLYLVPKNTQTFKSLLKYSTPFDLKISNFSYLILIFSSNDIAEDSEPDVATKSDTKTSQNIALLIILALQRFWYSAISIGVGLEPGFIDVKWLIRTAFCGF